MTGGRYRPMYFHSVKAGARRGRQAGRLAAPDRRPVDPHRHAVRGAGGRQGRRRHLGRGRVQPALCRAPPRGRSGHDQGRRAGAVVALGGPYPHRLRDRGDDRRARGSGRQGSGRVPAGAACRTIHATPACCGWRPRRRAGARHCRRAGFAASRSTRRSTPSWPRSPRSRSTIRRRPKVERVVCAVDCGSRGQSGRDQGADGGRHRLRPRRHPAPGDQPRRRQGRGDQLRRATRCCGWTRCRRSRSTSCRRPNGRPASASRACRRSARRSPTPIARPPARRSPCCRSPRDWRPESGDAAALSALRRAAISQPRALNSQHRRHHRHRGAVVERGDAAGDQRRHHGLDEAQRGRGGAGGRAVRLQRQRGARWKTIRPNDDEEQASVTTSGQTPPTGAGDRQGQCRHQHRDTASLRQHDHARQRRRGGPGANSTGCRPRSRPRPRRRRRRTAMPSGRSRP